MLAKRLFLSIFKLVPIFLEFSLTLICSVISDVLSIYPVFIPSLMLWVLFTVMCLIYLISLALDYCIWHKLLLITTSMQLLLFLIFNNTIVLTIGISIFSIILILYLIFYVKNNSGKFIETNRKRFRIGQI